MLDEKKGHQFRPTKKMDIEAFNLHVINEDGEGDFDYDISIDDMSPSNDKNTPA